MVALHITLLAFIFSTAFALPSESNRPNLVEKVHKDLAFRLASNSPPDTSNFEPNLPGNFRFHWDPRYVPSPLGNPLEQDEKIRSMRETLIRQEMAAKNAHEKARAEWKNIPNAGKQLEMHDHEIEEHARNHRYHQFHLGQSDNLSSWTTDDFKAAGDKAEQSAKKAEQSAKKAKQSATNAQMEARRN